MLRCCEATYPSFIQTPGELPSVGAGKQTSVPWKSSKYSLAPCCLFLIKLGVGRGKHGVHVGVKVKNNLGELFFS